MKYSILLHKSEFGYDVHVPALPGCHSQGATETEALANISDAIRTYVEMEQEELKNALTHTRSEGLFGMLGSRTKNFAD